MAPTRLTFPNDEIKRALARVAQEEPRIVKRTMHTTGGVLKKEQQRIGIVPYKEGHLRREHRFEVSPDGRKLTLSANTDYALIVHETHKTKGRWFVNVIERLAPSTLLKALQEAVKRFRG